MGQTLMDQWSNHYECLAPGRSLVDLAAPNSLERSLSGFDFDAIVNCAALARPDDCEEQPELAVKINSDSPAQLARLAAGRNVPFIHISTDQVFEGEGSAPLSEEDPAEPINTYGQTKRAAERAILERNPTACIARVSWLFGRFKSSHPDHVIERALSEPRLTAVSDKWSIPTHQTDLARWIRVLLEPSSSLSGIVHLSPTGAASWLDWTEATLEIARELGLPIVAECVDPVPLSSFPSLRAKRPRYTVLSNGRFSQCIETPILDWRDGLRDYLTQQYGCRMTGE